MNLSAYIRKFVRLQLLYATAEELNHNTYKLDSYTCHIWYIYMYIHTYLCIYRHAAYIYGSKAEWLAKQEQKTEQKRLIHKKLNVKTHCYCSRNSASVSWITCNASNCHSPAPTSLPVAHTHTATHTRMQLSTYHTYAHTELSPFQIAVEVLNKWSGFW